MRDTAVSSTPRRRRSLRRAFTAFAAVPTALALGSGLFAAAPATAVDVTNQAQNSLFGSSDVTDYLETDGVPQRTPIRTDEPYCPVHSFRRHAEGTHSGTGLAGP